MGNKPYLFFLIFLIAALTACAVPFHKKLDAYLQAGQYKEADALIDSEKANSAENTYGDRNTLLYFFDKGAVEQMMGDYETSNAALEQADEKIDRLFTRSVVNEVGSLLSNDLALEYTGEDFEQAMVDILKALNYMYKGDFQEARVEVKKIDLKLNVFADNYGDKAIYTDDAFARYISGFAYEALGEINDAYIDYKKSLKDYEKYSAVYGTDIPPFIRQDILRTASALHLSSEIDGFEKDWGHVEYTPAADLKSKGEVLIVVYDGLPAYKIDDNRWPKFIDRGYAISDVKAKEGAKEYQGYVCQDVSRIAVKNLETKNLQILGKKVASSVVKNLVKDVPIVNFFVQEDKADTRCWRTIPARFHIIRMALDPGKKKIEVELYPSSGAEMRVEMVEADVIAGKKIVVPVFVFSAEKAEK
jgi:tetratricopeptide (TPR) repeat protein